MVELTSQRRAVMLTQRVDDVGGRSFRLAERTRGEAGEVRLGDAMELRLQLRRTRGCRAKRIEGNGKSPEPANGLSQQADPSPTANRRGAKTPPPESAGKISPDAKRF